MIPALPSTPSLRACSTLPSRPSEPACAPQDSFRPGPELVSQLKQALGDHPFFIPKAQVEQLKAQLGLTDQQLLQSLVPVALPLARADVSHHNVGQASLGESGNIYLSVNLEFPGSDPHQTVHGEQFLVVNAMTHGETRILKAALTGSPCGGCRQFLNETAHGPQMELLLYNKSPQDPNYGKATTLAQLNPEPFGSGTLLEPQHVPLGALTDARPSDNQSLDEAALDAARGSYVRKYHTAAGVALKLADGSVYQGSYLEISGQNASLSPLQTALIRMAGDGRSWNSIRQVVLVQEGDAPFSQVEVTRSLLKSISPGARMTVRHSLRQDS